MSSTTTSSNMTDYFDLPPASATDRVTDADIAVLSRFLVQLPDKTLGYPRWRLGNHHISRIMRTPLRVTAGFDRLRKVLDSLVAIAVCRDTQYLALSVSLGAKVRITIAQNDEYPPPKISEYLQNVWKQLRELANIQRAVRHPGHWLDMLISAEEFLDAFEAHMDMADIENKRFKLLKDKLDADIYEHCYMKLKKRMNKYLAPFIEFQTFYSRTRAQLDPELVIADIVFSLAKVTKMVSEYKGKFDESGSPVDMEWSDVAKMFRVVAHLYLNDTANVTAKIKVVVDAWRSQSDVQANEGLYTFNLISALEKMGTLPRQIQVLVNLACSPQLGSIFEKELDVVLLRPATVNLVAPSAEDKTRIVERAFNATPFSTGRRMEELQDLLTEQLKMAQETDLPPSSVHAEYTLLLHHHSQPHDHANPPPLRYIATTKRPCSSCWSAYKAYTHITGCIFSLRSHSGLEPLACATTHQFGKALGAAMRTYRYSELVALYSERLTHIEDDQDRSTGESHRYNCVLADLGDVSAARRMRQKEDAEMDIGQEVVN